MKLSILAQILDATFGFAAGFDIVADHVEQYLYARSFIATLKFV